MAAFPPRACQLCGHAFPNHYPECQNYIAALSSDLENGADRLTACLLSFQRVPNIANRCALDAAARDYQSSWIADKAKER